MQAETLLTFIDDCFGWQGEEAIYSVPYPAPRIYDRIAEYIGLDDMGYVTMRHMLRIEKLARRYGIELPSTWREIRAAALRRASYKSFINVETGELITLVADWRNPESTIKYRYDDDCEFLRTPFLVRDCQGIPRRALRLVYLYAVKMGG